MLIKCNFLKNFKKLGFILSANFFGGGVKGCSQNKDNTSILTLLTIISFVYEKSFLDYAWLKLTVKEHCCFIKGLGQSL